MEFWGFLHLFEQKMAVDSFFFFFFSFFFFTSYRQNTHLTLKIINLNKHNPWLRGLNQLFAVPVCNELRYNFITLTQKNLKK